MLKQRPLLVEVLTAIGLIAAPFILPHLGFSPTTINRILVWGLFGIGFDILFGFTGLLSFGQSAFFGTGGMVAAYLLTVAGFPYPLLSLVIGMLAATVIGYLVGLIAIGIGFLVYFVSGILGAVNVMSFNVGAGISALIATIVIVPVLTFLAIVLLRFVIEAVVALIAIAENTERTAQHTRR